MDTAAIIAAAAAIIAALIAGVNTRIIHNIDRRVVREKKTTDFVSSQLEKLYIPVSSSLKITKVLFNRYFSTTDEAERTSIEHAWRENNTIVKEHIIRGSTYFDPDYPKEMIDSLIEHLVQWETVYKLKYEYKSYEGPVFAGIERFGFRNFPRGVDDYFNNRTDQFRKMLHEHLI